MKGKVSPAPSTVHLSQGLPSLLCLWRAKPQQGLQQHFCHSLWYLCSGKKRGLRPEKKMTWWVHPKGSHREDQILGFYCDTNLSQSEWGQRTGLLWASLPGQKAGTQIAVNILKICSLFDIFPISLTNTAAPSREALAASDIGSWFPFSVQDINFSPVLIQFTHICYSTLCENANFLVQVFSSTPSLPCYILHYSDVLWALTCHVPFIAHQDPAPNCRVLPQVPRLSSGNHSHS